MQFSELAAGFPHGEDENQARDQTRAAVYCLQTIRTRKTQEPTRLASEDEMVPFRLCTITVAGWKYP